MRYFEKIKYDPNKGETLLRWTEVNVNEAVDIHELRSPDEPHPDFVIAMQALRDVVRAACDLDDGAHLTIRGLTIKDVPGADGESTQGVTITALRELDWCSAPLVLNTPFAPTDSIPHLRAFHRVGDVIDEADAFVSGKRRQGDLFASAVSPDRDAVTHHEHATEGIEAEPA